MHNFKTVFSFKKCISCFSCLIAHVYLIIILSIFYQLCYYSCLNFSPLPPPLGTSLPSNMFVSIGHAYKFFGFSISYTILNISLSVLYLPIMLLNPCTLSSIFSLPLPTDNLPYDLHIYDSAPVLVVCLVCFCFLYSVIVNCEFVVILLFTVLSLFFLLNKSL